MIERNRIGNSGPQVSALGFGGAPLGGLLKAVEKHEALGAVDAALEAGVTYFDTAPFYGFGRSERIIGDQLLNHNNITLSTKVGRILQPGMPDDPAAMGWPTPLPFHPVYDYSRDGIMRSVDNSYQRLGLDKIDILYVHDIGELTHGDDHAKHFRDLEQSGYAALDELRKNGAIGAIGLGVNEIPVCLDALKIGDWDVFLLAGRYTLLEQDALDGLLPQCIQTKTDIVIGGPYNSGILVGGDTWNYEAAPDHIVQTVQKMKNLAKAHNVPLPAAALQFPLAHPAVVSVIPGVRTAGEFSQTLQWAKSTIPNGFWDEMQSEGLIRSDAPIPEKSPY